MDLDSLLEKAKRAAERCADDLHTNSFAPSMAIFTDDGNPRVFLLPSIEKDTSRQPLAFATKVLASAVDNLSEIIWLMDSWQCTRMTKTNGEQWGQGEMQEAVENDTEDAQYIFECLSLNIVDSDGTLGAVNVKYTREDGKIVFHWDDATNYIETEDGPQASGNFPEMLRAAAAAPKLRDHARKEAADHGLDIDNIPLSIEQQRIHTLVAGLKFVFNAGIQINCLIPTYNDMEGEVVKRIEDGANVRSYTETDLDEIKDLEDLYEKS